MKRGLSMVEITIITFNPCSFSDIFCPANRVFAQTVMSGWNPRVRKFTPVKFQISVSNWRISDISVCASILLYLDYECDCTYRHTAVFSLLRNGSNLNKLLYPSQPHLKRNQLENRLFKWYFIRCINELIMRTFHFLMIL